MKIWHCTILMLVLGYIIGYYWPSVGDMTVGKIVGK